MSLEKPGSLTSSASGVANGEPGRITPPTERSVEMRDRPWLPPQRSIAISSARRTRTSSNGFFSTLKQTSRLSVQLDSSMRILSPIACTSRSRSAGEMPRNSPSTWPPCTRVEHGGRLQREDALEAVEIGQALLEVGVVLLAGDVAALDVLDEGERAGAVDLGARRLPDRRRGPWPRRSRSTARRSARASRRSRPSS